MTDWMSFIKEVKEAFADFEHVYAAMTYTDKFEVLSGMDFLREYVDGKSRETEQVPEEVRKLLDVRIFNEHKELHLYRDYIGNNFSELVELDDEKLTKETKDRNEIDTYDDYQCLDIDMKRTDRTTGIIRAAGGGQYRFPLEASQKLRVRVRNYVAYDENGQAYIKAWRLAGFTEE